MTYARHSLIYMKQRAEPLLETDPFKRALFRDWVSANHPLICTRQPKTLSPDTLQVAISHYDKDRDEKHRFSYLIRKLDILNVKDLPNLGEIFSTCVSYDVQVYGSYCWQYLTKSNYVRSESDLDLLIRYKTESLSQISFLLDRLKNLLAISKIDGEIRFENIGDCSLLELLDTRSNSILFKNTCDVSLMNRTQLYAMHPSLIQ